MMPLFHFTHFLNNTPIIYYTNKTRNNKGKLMLLLLPLLTLYFAITLFLQYSRLIPSIASDELHVSDLIKKKRNKNY